MADGVLAELDRIRVSHPSSPEAALARVDILCSLGKDVEATAAIQTALETRPDAARSMIPRLEAIISRTSPNATALMALATAHRALNDATQAGKACREAYQTDRAAAPQVIRFSADLISSDPQAIVPYLTMAEIYLDDGEISAAAEKLAQVATRMDAPLEEMQTLLDQVIQRDSGTARVAFLAGEILHRFGQPAAAVGMYKKSLERDPGMLDAVLKGYVSILEQDAELGEARLARAQALALQQEFGEATEELEKAVHSTPSLASEVIDEAKRIHERLSDNYPLIRLLSDLLLGARRLEEAGEILAPAVGRKWERRILKSWRAESKKAIKAMKKGGMKTAKVGDKAVEEFFRATREVQAGFAKKFGVEDLFGDVADSLRQFRDARKSR